MILRFCLKMLLVRVQPRNLPHGGKSKAAALKVKPKARPYFSSSFNVVSQQISMKYLVFFPKMKIHDTVHSLAQCLVNVDVKIMGNRDQH